MGKKGKCVKKSLQFHHKTDILTLAVFVMKIGSCAILRREPCQVLTEAAVSVRRMCCGVARSERARFFLSFFLNFFCFRG